MKFLGHSLHPILVVFPLGLLSTSAVFDALYLLTGSTLFPIASSFAIAAGVLSGLATMFFGLLDMYRVRRDTRAMNLVGWHSVGNFLAIEIFVLSWLARQGSPDLIPNNVALGLSFAGVAILLITGWMGGEMVYRLGLAVDSGANQDAPNSLTHKSATKINLYSG